MPAPGQVDHRAYAGLVSRALALTVDLAVLTAGGLAVGALPVLAWQQVLGPPPTVLKVATASAAALLPWFYFTGCWWLSGRTVGGAAIGSVVLRRGGGDLGLFRAAFRAAGGLLLWPVWLVGMLGILWDERRRAWHDRAFGTEVRYRRTVTEW